MKIVFLMVASIDRPAGRRYLPIARHLVRQGNQVRILALHPDLSACTQRRLVVDGVEVWYVGQMHARKQGNAPQQFGILRLLIVLIHATLGMLWGLLCSPADVYHLCKPQPVNGLAAFVGLGLLQGRRFYVDCDDDEAASNYFSANWQRWVFAFWQWLLIRYAAGITVNTQAMAARVRRQRSGHSSGPVVYVPNGVDPEHFQRPPESQCAALREALGLDGCRVVGYVGTLALHSHPVDMLIDAFAEVVHAVPDAALLLVGTGKDMSYVRARVAELGLQQRVWFTGQLPYQSVRPYVALADVSVDPVYDNAVARARSPLKIFESMALGIPVVTGDVGDRALLLDQGRAGILVHPGNTAALATGIDMLLSNDMTRQAMAHAASQHVLRYSWQQLAHHWSTVYQS
jgi:glycosyltransferase involved in cell wall biosynthesis